MGWSDTRLLGTELELVADFDLSPLLQHFRSNISVVRDSVEGARRTLWLQLVQDLATTIESPRYSETVGLPEAIAAVLVAIREMDLALPDHERDPIVEPPSLSALPQPGSACPPPIRLPFEPAGDLVVMAMGHSRPLDRLIPAVLKTTPDGLRKPTVRLFGEVMGRLYTELIHPLHQQHNELEPLVLGPRAE